MNYVTITASLDGRSVEIGKGTGPLKPTAEQNAASDALRMLKRRGFKRPVPEAFAKFCDSPKEKATCSIFTSEMSEVRTKHEKRWKQSRGK